jgi:hypothetical protein
MSKLVHFIHGAPLRLAALLGACLLILAACSSDRQAEEKKKDERPPQEKVLILKQRFDQLDDSLKQMEKDLQIQKKRIDGTRELVESIRHSLTKGGLKGYSLENVSTTDPLLLQAINKDQAQKKEKKEREHNKDKADDRILNGLLIAAFLLIIIAIFVVALKDKKSEGQPFDAQVMPPYPNDDKGVTETYDGDRTPGIDDTGSFEYGELQAPKPKVDENPQGPDEEQPL